MNRIRTYRTVALLSIALLGFLTLGTAYAQASDAPQPPGTAALGERAAAFYAVAATMGVACLAAAFAVAKVGAAAMGAAAEKPEILTKAIVFAGLGEGIAIFGLIVSLFLLNKI